MKIKNNNYWGLQQKGFSLVELIVVVAIIAIMSVSSVVGFRYMGEGLRKQETKGIISDLIKRTELEILRGDYSKSTINFLEDFLVIDGDLGDQEIVLTLDDNCTNGYQIKSDMPGTLYKKDIDGNVLDAGFISGNTCIEFNESEEREWQLQVITTDSHSNILRFVHFNVNRENLNNPILIKDGADAKLEIEAPYAKKILSTTPITLGIGYLDDEDNETLVLN